MERLENEYLSVELIDPKVDWALLGSRFCWGGYMWQVRDAHGKPLLSGPEWPSETPDPFNGQGLPEVLRHTELSTGRALTHSNGQGIVLGAGVAKWESGDPVIVTPATWLASREGNTAHFETRHSGYGFSAEVKRSIKLEGATIVSATSVTNLGSSVWPLHWFAHPFFPLEDGVLTVRFPRTVEMAENPGFRLREGELTFGRKFEGVDDGHFQRLTPDAENPFSAVMSHPVVGEVTMQTSFAADQLYVWANGNTFSVEPYLLRQARPNDVIRWWVRYSFGRV